MSPERAIAFYVFFMLCACKMCKTSEILERNFEHMIDMIPMGQAYGSYITRSRLECSRLCAGDPTCTKFTVKNTGPKVECGLYTCWDSMQNSTLTDVKTFIDQVSSECSCPSSFSRGPDNHCYHYDTGRLSRAESVAHCTSTDPEAYIVEINSSEENEYIRNLLSFEPWVGGRLLSGTYTWTHSGQDLVGGYMNWASDAPVGSECICMIQSTGQWYDAPCQYTRHTVCEYAN